MTDLTPEWIRDAELALAGVKCPKHGVLRSKGYSRYYDRFSFDHGPALTTLTGEAYRKHGADACRQFLALSCTDTTGQSLGYVKENER